MYRFYYDYVKPRYGKKCKLLFIDTDFLSLKIKTPDLYCDMGEAMDLYDTNNFETDYRLYSTQNHRVLSKMKSETGFVFLLKFVIKPKCTVCYVKKILRERSRG